MVPKCEYPTLEPTLPSAGLKGSGQLHLEMQQTAVDGFSLAEDSSRELGGDFSFQEDFENISEKTTSQVTARQEFPSLPMSRQQQEVVQPSGEQHKQYNPCR